MLFFFQILVFLVSILLVCFGAYLALRGQVATKKPTNRSAKNERTVEQEATINRTESLVESTPVQQLEEAITLAITDGKLNEQEELIIREHAILAGKDPDELIEQLKEDVFGDEETEIGEGGLTFEKFILQQFNPDYFMVDHWSGDKFIAERYTKETIDPDIQITISTAEGRFPLAVECKWRSHKVGGYISFADDHQLEDYQHFEKKTGKPTFIALGLGGRPSDPEELYLIPVQDFKRGTQHQSSLTHYRKPNPEQGFFFDIENTRLM